MDAQRPVPITFYTKPGCHLCEDVADHLEELARRWALHLNVVDITSDLDLHRRFWDKIPVVVIGQHVFQAPIQFDALARFVAVAAQSKQAGSSW